MFSSHLFLCVTLGQVMMMTYRGVTKVEKYFNFSLLLSNREYLQVLFQALGNINHLTVPTKWKAQTTTILPYKTDYYTGDLFIYLFILDLCVAGKSVMWL